MTHVTCRLTAKNRDQLRNPRSVIEYGLALPLPLSTWRGALVAVFGCKSARTSSIRTELNWTGTLAWCAGLRILVMLLLDTLPMLGNVLMLCFFVFFIFGIVGVQLWAGRLRNRCYLVLPDNVSADRSVYRSCSAGELTMGSGLPRVRQIGPRRPQTDVKNDCFRNFEHVLLWPLPVCSPTEIWFYVITKMSSKATLISIVCKSR